MNTSEFRPLPSLRRDVVRTLGLIGAVWILVVFLAIIFVTKREVDGLMDGALQESAEMLYGVVALSDDFISTVDKETLPAPPHDETMVWQIVNTTGKVLYRSHKAPDQAMVSVFKPGLYDGLFDYRVYAMGLPASNKMLYVGQPNKYRSASRYDIIWLIGLSGVLIGGICIVWMGFRIRRALQPLAELGDQVQDYDPMVAQTTLPPASREEFVQIREAILDLGSRLAQRVHNEQAFAAHAAHALRTPLAAMDLQLASVAKVVPDPFAERIQLARQAAVRLKRVITGLLSLFRSRAELSVQQVDLHEVVHHVQNGLDVLHVEVVQKRRLWADPDLLSGVLANLFENSVRYGASQCSIVLDSVGDLQRLTVKDNGPGVSKEKCEQLEAVASQQDVDGFVGLGLKLAALFAKAHKGHLALKPSTSEVGGFTVVLTFPVIQTDPRSFRGSRMK
jgi:signal transduction histidine kinase